MQRGAMRIVAVEPQAARRGILPGLMLADARARLPELAAIDHDPPADTRWLERIADLCERWTPMVAPDPPDGLTLDITGHPFGSEARLIAEMERVLHRAGCTLRHACAASPEAAQALARHQTAPAPDEAAAIRRLPLAALRAEEEVETALLRAGLKTIGDLAQRPTAPLAARFGEGLTDMLARLIGRSDSRIVPRRAPPALLFERRFAEPLGRTEHALAVIDELVAEAAVALEQRHGGGRRFAARFYRSDGAVRDIGVETGLPTRDPNVTARLFRERIDALADPIDPGFGFDLIRLAIAQVEPLAATQLDLAGGSVSEEAMAALVDRLSTRLGRQRVRRVRAVDTHIPEQQTLALPAVQLAEPAPWSPPAQGEPPLRPLHLFDPPQPIEVTAYGVPDGPPSAFRWRRATHEVLRYEGPERIAGEWWRVRVDRLPDPAPSVVRATPGRDAMDCDEEEAAQDAAPAKGPPQLTRDYFRVEDRRGRRFWLFRHGLLGRETGAPAWYLHGLFA
jgi:protein ImuB